MIKFLGFIRYLKSVNVLQNVSTPAPRCVSKQTYLEKGDLWCEKSAVIDHKNRNQTIDDQQLSSEDKEPIQVQPQKIKLYLRPGERKISPRFTIFIY